MDEPRWHYSNEISHREKDNYCTVLPYMWTQKERKKKKSNSQKQSRMVAAKGWKVGKKGRGWQMVTNFQL